MASRYALTIIKDGLKEVWPQAEWTSSDLVSSIQFSLLGVTPDLFQENFTLMSLPTLDPMELTLEKVSNHTNQDSGQKSHNNSIISISTSQKCMNSKVPPSLQTSSIQELYDLFMRLKNQIIYTFKKNLHIFLKNLINLQNKIEDLFQKLKILKVFFKKLWRL